MNLKLLDKKTWLLIGIEVATLFLFYLLVVRPHRLELRRVKHRVQEEEARYARLSVLSSLIDEFREKKAGIGKTIDRFLKVREKGEMGLVVPAGLVDIFRESEVEVVSIKPVPERVEGDLLVSSWDINVACGYHELGHFISRLERSADFDRIDSLTISTEGTSSKQRAELIVSRISLLKKEEEQ